MPLRSIDQGIQAVQAGRLEEGARLLRIAMRSPELSGAMRAIACLWLAETTNDPQTKGGYYNDALTADPNNPQIRQRVETWMASQRLPPAPAQPSPMPPLPPQQPLSAPPRATSTGTFPVVVNRPGTGPLGVGPGMQSGLTGGVYHIVGVFGGPNGPGTGFFVARDGYIATSRYVTGDRQQVTVELETGRQIPGQVVRSYGEIDLAIVYVEQLVNDLLPISPLPRIPEEMTLTVVSYNSQMARGKRRGTKRVLPPQWFPTSITQPQLPDAGGCPVLDERQYLVGMITRNTSSSSNLVYGIYINVIRNYLEALRQEMLDGLRAYCPDCGSLSKAIAAGGYYCEVCGSVSPQAEHVQRVWRPQMAGYYHEHSRLGCMYCNATVGFYNNACLRCGRTMGGA